MYRQARKLTIRCPAPLGFVGVCALLLQSCVGIGIVGSERSEREPADVFFCVEQAISTQVVIDRWGQPDSIAAVSDGSSVWTYDSDLRWGGLVLCVVIPVPLMLPIGPESTSLTVRDGVVVAANHLRQTTTLYVAGVVPGICYDFGVGVYHR